MGRVEVNYLYISIRNLHLPLIEGQTVPSSPSDTHFELRKMLQKILDEVAKLPSLLNHSGFPLRPEEHLPYFSPKKYEQLLATAVLNKVVEDYRNPKNFEHVKPEADTTTTTTAGPPTTGATSAGSAPATGTTFDINHNKVPGKSLLNEANLRKMSLDKELKEDLYSRSLSESDESYLSDYIQKHTVPLPDLSDTTGSGPEDDVLSLKSNNTDGTWEENWLFKKRQLKSTESSIAMLVPSPTEEVKALIGDKNADEVSDLSEAGSDVEEYDSDSNPKNTTTGDTGSSPKKTLEDHTQDSLISINSIASNEPVLSEAKNELLLEEQQCAVENLVNDLISIEPCLIKTEAANPALIDSQSNAFLSGPESVLIEENNNVIKQEEVKTDDIKLMQERIQNAPKQRDVDGNVLHPIGIARTIPVEGHSTECDRKEVPIDRAQSEPEKQKPSETSNGHVPAVTTNGVSTDDSVEDEMLIPGSIAEREHLKWRNASPIPNNPYSPDVLQKRLEESNRRSSLIDFDRLASRDPTSPTLEVPDDSELPADSKEEDDAVENDRSLQSVLGANPNQYQRYGRDYYINDAKRACGSRKQTPDLPTQLTHSTDDEKSLLLSQKQEQPTSPISCLEKNDQQPTTEAFPFVKSSSCGNVADKNQSEDIFSAARPIEVKPDDPILKKGTKVEYLSTPAREIYLVPADEPTTPHSLGSSSELSMASRADESLTFSEDSDVTRIYEIGTGESKVIHGDIIGGEKDTGQTPPSTPTYGAQLVDTSHPIDEEQTMNKLNTLKQQESEVLSEEILSIVPQIRAPTPEPIPEEPSSPTIDRSHLLKPHLLKNKPLSPETIKFFSPKKPFSPNLGASSSLSQSTTEIRDLPHHPMNHYHSSLHIDYPPTRPAPIHHDFIIEKEVMEVLPSVKELAKCYSGSQQDVNAVPRPLHRPKDFIRQSSDMLHEEQPQETRSGMPHVENKNRRMYCSTSSITAAEEIRVGRRANVEAYNPPTFVPMAPGHSITARSLSKQIRDELKINATDDHKVQGGHTSPERPSSPVFAPGHLRSSIQFFESLREK
ncbi:AAEL005174-PA [Aedes aegypti]|uniref:AAEL005174-PA n=1 Tax=Aedes aegypti TaxID=7159 RepID=Q17AU7_AEDAE|nr:AAEL005174-PA [Aedes aegypti]